MPNAKAVQAALERFENLHPEVIDLSLHRILDVLESLGRPQDALPPTIHVAGTNGKGSVCAFMRSMAEAAGLKVHAFTSPHLVRFNERIRIAGELIGDDALVAWLDQTVAALNGRPITHFEATTAAALLAFSKVPADLLILEVGLGGRYDATNVIDRPAMSVITPIDFDHQQFLGSDLAGIAVEKAGIIKTGRPVVSARQLPECADVIERTAQRLSAPLHVIDLNDIAKVPKSIGLVGSHQRANAALAATALRRLSLPSVTEAALATGAQETRWPARMQKLSSGPLTDRAGDIDVWLDGGHNPHAASAIAAFLREIGGQTVLVSAMMASKDHAGYFAAFGAEVEAIHTCPNAPGHAGAEPDELASIAGQFVASVSAHASFHAAFAAALATRPDRILICGSLYLAGEVLAENAEPPD